MSYASTSTKIDIPRESATYQKLYVYVELFMTGKSHHLFRFTNLTSQALNLQVLAKQGRQLVFVNLPMPCCKSNSKLIFFNLQNLLYLAILTAYPVVRYPFGIRSIRFEASQESKW